MADIEQQARELLAEQYRADGQPVLAHAVEHGASSPWADTPLRAVAAALRAVPEGFALVDLDENSILPDTPTERMLDVGWPDNEFIGATFDKEGAYADLLAAVLAPTTLATVKPPRARRTRLREDV